MVKLENINKYYDSAEEPLHVLKDINLHVKKGEFVSVLGPSGSGKSTLMNLIGCMDIGQLGSYTLEGIEINTCTEQELSSIRNEKIGFIFQKYHLISQYNVLQNIMLPLLLRGKLRKEVMEEVKECAYGLGLGEKLDRKPSELSGGQQQRVAIARALITKPSILLADEPTGALDSTTGKDVLQFFQKLNNNGHTIIMITHDKNVAEVAERTVIIEDGILYEI